MQSVEASPASKVTGEHLGLGIAFTLLGGVGWGFSGTCAQFLFTNYDVEPTWLVAVRMVIAALMFAPLVLGTHRREEAELIRDKPNILITLVFAVFGLFACSSSYLMSIQASDAGTATVLQSLNLLLILVVSCVQMHRLPKRKEAIGVVLALVGTFLIATQGSFTSLSISAAALFWGICNAVACALYTLLPAKPLARHGSVAVTGTAICIVAVVACVVYQPWSHMPTLDLVGWLAVFGVAAIGTFGSFLLYVTGVKIVGGLLAGLLASTEPIVACVLSVVWMGTVFSGFDLVGMALIIIMMLLMV